MAKLISSKAILKTPIFTVTDNTLLDPEGNRIRRIMVSHPGSVAVLALHEGRICLVKQYRYPAMRYMWELPGGVIDPGENPLSAAKRELAEETGLRAGKWKKLATFYPSAGFQQEKMTVFLATGISEGETALGSDEFLQVKWFDRRKVESQVLRGKILDAKTIVGVQFLAGLRLSPLP